MLVHRCEVVQIALRRHRPDPDDAPGTLAAVGGFEHAALAGLICAAVVDRVPLVLDGVVATAAALAAVGVCLQVAGYLIPGRCSTEPAADVALDQLCLAPLLDLQYRAGRALHFDALAHFDCPTVGMHRTPLGFRDCVCQVVSDERVAVDATVGDGPVWGDRLARAKWMTAAND